jgi:hypothetical protein
MAVVYNTTLKNTRLTDVVTAIDAGGAGALKIGTTALGTILSTITFNATCGTVSGGVLTFSGTPLTDSSAANSGTAAAAKIISGTPADIVTGLTVGTSGTDVVFSSVSIVAGQPVTLTAASITHG